jgi:Leucine-rich repeat (LRR) protein
MPPEIIETLKKYLQTNEEANIEIAFQMLEGIGMPEDAEFRRLMADTDRKVFFCLKFGWKYLADTTTELNFSGFDLCDEFEKVFELKNLQKLNLAYTGIRQLPTVIGDLKNLTYLNLSHNHLQKLPVEFAQLTALEELDLDYNSMPSLPSEILALKQLKNLSIEDNPRFVRIEGIGDLENLEILDVRDTGLTAIPAEIGQLQRLRSLKIARTRLTALPPEIQGLKNLEQFYFAQIPNLSFPLFVLEMPHLKELSLSKHLLTPELENQLKEALPNTAVKTTAP